MTRFLCYFGGLSIQTQIKLRMAYGKGDKVGIDVCVLLIEIYSVDP